MAPPPSPSNPNSPLPSLSAFLPVLVLFIYSHLWSVQCVLLLGECFVALCPVGVVSKEETTEVLVTRCGEKGEGDQLFALI